MDRDGDGIDDEIAALVRMAIGFAARLAEEYARHREQEARRAEAESERRRQEYQRRVDAERAAARAQLQPVLRDEWWKKVTPERIGTAYEAAASWAQFDDVARQAADRIREEVRARYDVDVDELAREALIVRTPEENAARKTIDELDPDERRLSYLEAQRWLADSDPELGERVGLTVLNAASEAECVAAQNAAIEAHRRRLEVEVAVEEIAVADLVDENEEARRQSAAQRADEAVRQADDARSRRILEEQNSRALGEWQSAGAEHSQVVDELQGKVREVVGASVEQLERDLRLAHWYDTADRRKETEADLTATVDDPEGVEVRMLDDMSNAHPPKAAVGRRKHVKARKSKGTPESNRELGQGL
jgi:hypothetical protein